MVGGPAAADAIKRARACPTCGSGFTSFWSMASRSRPGAQIPALVERRGRLRNDLAVLRQPQIASPSRAAANEHGNHRAVRSLSRDRVAARSRQHAPAFPSASDRCRCDCQHRAALRHAGAARSRRTLADRRRHRSARRNRLAGRDRRAVGRVAARGSIHRAGLTTADAVFGLAWSGAMTQTSARRAAWPAAPRPRRNLSASGDNGCVRRRGARLSVCRRVRGACAMPIASPPCAARATRSAATQTPLT